MVADSLWFVNTYCTLNLFQLELHIIILYYYFQTWFIVLFHKMSDLVGMFSCCLQLIWDIYTAESILVILVND